MITEKSRPREEGGSTNNFAGQEFTAPLIGASTPSQGEGTTRDLGTWYWRGVHHERRRIAEAWTELDQVWRPMGTRLHADRVQARRDLFRECAQEFAEQAGRTYVEYTGGPVDWETGKPLTLPERVKQVAA